MALNRDIAVCGAPHYPPPMASKIATYPVWILWCLLPALGFGQATAAFDGAIVETGEAFQLHVRTALPPETVDLSNWAPWFPEENILSRSPWKEDAGQWQQDLTLICFDADTLRLPPPALILSSGDTLMTNPLKLLVVATPSPDEPADMADIKDIIPEPALWTDYLPWILFVAGLILLAVLAYFLPRLWRRRQAMRSRSVQAPAHEQALRRLTLLEKQQLWQQDRYAEYYAVLSHILREYLERRYGFPALESVTEIILQRLPHYSFPEALLPPTESFLRWSDLAKFAKAVPPPNYHEQSFEFIKSLIHHTKEIPLPEPTP
jgi:hypothetical protein